MRNFYNERQKIVQANGTEAIEKKNHLISLLQNEKMLELKSITHEDSCTRYHFCAKSYECDNICDDIPREKTSDCDELETFAV